MSKSSTVTERTTAVRAAIAAGGVVACGEMLTVQTDERVQLVDLTDRIMALVVASGVREGLASLWSMHTTCALFINESQRALHADIRQFLEQIVIRDGGWRHNDPDCSDCDRMNADSHLRAMLLGHSVTLQVAGGEVALGQWQRVLMAELDGPRSRTLRLQIMGLA